MRSPEPVTPAEAQVVWNTIKNPSARSVARALSQAGRRVHHSTIARWNEIIGDAADRDHQSVVAGRSPFS
jgi:transposase-like protein